MKTSLEEKQGCPFNEGTGLLTAKLISCAGGIKAFLEYKDHTAICIKATTSCN
jgi:hypothetical protein